MMKYTLPSTSIAFRLLSGINFFLTTDQVLVSSFYISADAGLLPRTRPSKYKETSFPPAT